MTSDAPIAGKQMTDAEAADVWPELEAQTEPTDENRIDLLDSRDLATMFGVSQRCICNWRRSGFTPRPVYSSGRVTLWIRAEIDRWREAGCPWANIPRAARQLQFYGAQALNEAVTPEDSTDWDRELTRKLKETLALMDHLDGTTKLPLSRMGMLTRSIERSLLSLCGRDDGGGE